MTSNLPYFFLKEIGLRNYAITQITRNYAIYALRNYAVYAFYAITQLTQLPVITQCTHFTRNYAINAIYAITHFESLDKSIHLLILRSLDPLLLGLVFFDS